MTQEIMSKAQEDIRKKILESINLTQKSDEILEKQVREEVDAYFDGKYVW